MSADAKPYVLVSAGLFAVISIIHLARAVMAWDFIIGPYHVPVAVSWLGFLVLAALSAWGFWVASHE